PLRGDASLRRAGPGSSPGRSQSLHESSGRKSPPIMGKCPRGFKAKMRGRRGCADAPPSAHPAAIGEDAEGGGDEAHRRDEHGLARAIPLVVACFVVVV